MKSIRVLAAVLFAMIVLTAVVSAADFTESVEKAAAPYLANFKVGGSEYAVQVKGGNGKIAGGISGANVVITPLSAVYASDAVAESDAGKALLEAKKELEENAVADLVPGFAEIWEQVTEGAPVVNATVCELFELAVNEDPADIGGEGSIMNFKLTGLDYEEGDPVVLLHKGADGWEVVEFSWYNYNTIMFSLTDCSPIALITDNGAAPVDPTDSPTTAVNGMSAVVCAALCAGLAAVAVVKAKKEF